MLRCNSKRVWRRSSWQKLNDNPDQKIILIDDAYEEIKNICINLQKDTDASNLEVKSLLKQIMNEWEETEEQKTGFGFR